MWRAKINRQRKGAWNANNKIEDNQDEMKFKEWVKINMHYYEVVLNKVKMIALSGIVRVGIIVKWLLFNCWQTIISSNVD